MTPPSPVNWQFRPPVFPGSVATAVRTSGDSIRTVTTIRGPRTWDRRDFTYPTTRVGIHGVDVRSAASALTASGGGSSGRRAASVGAFLLGGRHRTHVLSGKYVLVSYGFSGCFSIVITVGTYRLHGLPRIITRYITLNSNTISPSIR